MKKFAKKNITQKILIVIVMLMMFNFSIPKPVQADTAGTIFSPFMGLVGLIADGIEHLIEWAMLGETDNFMKSISEGQALAPEQSGAPTITVDSSNIDGTFWGVDEVNIPVIKYSPEEIFSGRVPALDVNFLAPEHPTDDRSAAATLQDTISSWYKALRSIAIVGLLTVIVYLGIRILITSLAADKAKYKKMIMDWLVAMCLLFVMHYIMSFLLTASQALIGILGGQSTGAVNISVTGSSAYSFSTNLIGYTRFMMQHIDLQEKVAFTVLYIMLLIFSVRFTWTYLKRVVNMAFLTIIAPFVTLTYPIDKVSDGKAQAFNIWLREYLFNCLIQPMHLLLYKVLLGSAIELASKNILYAIVCFGFIIAAEKLVKKMFGFDKASGGTIGSLAGAAGVTAVANKGLNMVGSRMGAKNKQNKIRTQDSKTPQRIGRDNDSNNVFQGFEEQQSVNRSVADALGGAAAEEALEEARQRQQPGNSEEEKRRREEEIRAEEQERQRQEQQRQEQERQRQQQTQEQEQQRQQNTQQSEEEQEERDGRRNRQEDNQENRQDNPNTAGSPNPNMTEQQLRRIRTAGNPLPATDNSPTFTGLVRGGARRVASGARKTIKGVRSAPRRIAQGVTSIPGNAAAALQAAPGAIKSGAKAGLNNLNHAAGKAMVGAGRAIKEVAPTAAYKVVRGGLKAGAMAAGALTIGTVAAAVAATTGDGEKGFGILTAGIGGGIAAGGALFEGTAGKAMPQRSLRGAIDTARYGSKRAAQNARADKEFLRSEEFEEYYNDQIRTSKDLKHMSKEEARTAFKEYRQCGITDNKQIKNALKLEQKEDSHGNKMFSRREVQNIVQSSAFIDQKAYRTEESRKAEIKRIEGMLSSNLTPQEKHATAKRIFKGNEMYRDM